MSHPDTNFLVLFQGYKILKVFGCACYPHLRPYNRNKLQYRYANYVFLGYSSRHRGYKSDSTSLESHQTTSSFPGRTASRTVSNSRPCAPTHNYIHPLQTRSQLGIRKPNLKYALLTSCSAEKEPTSYTSAAKDPRWQLAMADE